MTTFAQWIKCHDEIKLSGVAKKLGIARTTLHEILKKGLIPNLKLAYKIEVFTKSDVTLYDWIDHSSSEKSQNMKQTVKTKDKIRGKKQRVSTENSAIKSSM